MSQTAKRNFLVLFLSMMFLAAESQTSNPDTLQEFRQFYKICSDYQYLPLQLNLEIINSTNLIISRADTAHVTGVFDIQQNSSFISMNEEEEVLTDSSLLVANNKAKKLVISFEKNMPAADRLQILRQTYLTDTSAGTMADHYVVHMTDDASSGRLAFFSRKKLESTGFPAEEIAVEYNALSSEPELINVVRRRLFLIGQDTYDSLYRTNHQRDLVKLKSGETYLIKESQSTIRFKKIGHKVQLPSKNLDSYIIKDNEVLTPRDSYKGYTLTLLNQPN